MISRFLDKFYNFIDKVGKPNFMLMVFILFVIVVTGLYQTFSLYTSTDGIEVVDGLKTYKFILSNNDNITSITIAADSSKYIDITVTNDDSIDLKYGLYYSSSSDLVNVNIGYLESSKYLGTDNINRLSNNIVKLRIDNFSSNDVTVDFGVSYGMIDGGELTKESNQYWIDKYKDLLLSDYVINSYNGGGQIETVHIAGDYSKSQVYLNASQGIMLDNNGDYRYYGSNPNNYVEYNDELWRIISVGNVKANENDTVGETRVKIVKADILTAKETGTDTDITAFSYDSSATDINSGYGVNDWSQSDLMTELNTLYYNSTSGTCYIGQNNTSKSCDFTDTGLNKTSRSLTADALYYLGGSSSYEGLYADDYYDFERGTNVWGASGQTCNDGACPRATTWTGRVGIIYPSDYTYATDLSVCKSDGYYYDDYDCTDNNWLLNLSDYQWIISPNSSSAYRVFVVYSSGDVNYDGSAFDSLNVQPVQYLRADVAIVGGEGTSGKPYLLELS